MPPERLRVALDATPLAGERTGVGVFCAELLLELARRPGLEVGAFAISRRGRRALAGRLPGGVRALGLPGPGVPARALHVLWERWAFPPAELWAGRSKVVHGTNFVVPPAWRAATATVVTVHDLTPWEHPEWSLPAARAYPQLVQKAVERGAWAHADSESVAAELRKFLPTDRVRAIYPGAPTRLAAAAADAGAAQLLPEWARHYVLALSTVEPRKALPVLVRAFERIAGRHPGTALVIAGPDGWGAGELDRAIAASPARQQVVRLGWVGGQQRDALLAGATVFAYPSLYEGFGLPPLEAMAAGTPVVASSAGALPEVLGEAALLVPPGDPEALAGALDRLLGDPSARDELVAKGARQVALYSWERCADEMEALYREAAGA
jgi:glycosyltransferase involved in cell wall biosynthesis